MAGMPTPRRSAHLLPCLLLLAGLLFPVRLLAQNHPNLAADTELPLSAEQTATALGITDLFHRIQRSEIIPGPTSEKDRWDLLSARQELLFAVNAASLQVDATTGQIDDEISEARELQNYLNARRARQIDLLNLASLAIGGSLGTASAALGLTPHVRASGVTGIISGSSITTLSVIGLHVRKGGKDTLEARSNMLSKLFDLPSDPNDFYPPFVVSFMASPAPNDPERISRRDRLVQAWEKLGRIPPPTSEKRSAKLDRLASIPKANTSLSIGDLDDRQAMLYDLRARIMYVKRDLAILLAAVPATQTTLAVMTPQPAR